MYVSVIMYDIILELYLCMNMYYHMGYIVVSSIGL